MNSASNGSCQRSDEIEPAYDSRTICWHNLLQAPLGIKANDVEIKNRVAHPLRSIVLDRIRRTRERSGLLDASADIAFGLDVERSA